MPEPHIAIPAEHLARLEMRFAQGRRTLLGIVGAPGSGKSTLAQSLLHAFPQQTVVVPMDGFHLANAQLHRLGRDGRKGAPDTFDARGYLALLRRIRVQGPDEVVYAPEFRREIEEPVAGAIAVTPSALLVITEGNYLLLDDEPWASVRPLLDEVWFVEPDDALRRARLVQRHVQFGRSLQQARAWVASTDEPNARRVQATRHRADHVIGETAAAPGE
jgi:pantothenate kinase